MIQSFADSDTESVWQRRRVPRWAQELQRVAYRKLLLLDAAETLKDLGASLGNRLEKLVGDREGQYSMRVNDQWRVCFEWRNGDVYEVEIIDYH